MLLLVLGKGKNRYNKLVKRLGGVNIKQRYKHISEKFDQTEQLMSTVSWSGCQWRR